MSAGDTIVAQSTPYGYGGIGVVRLSGAKSIKILQAVSKTEEDPTDRTALKTTIRSGKKVIDEVVVICYKNPKSFTGEDVVEISCHGSPFIVESIIQECINHGLAATYMCSGLTAFGALKKLVNINDQDHILIMGLGGVGMMGLQFARTLFNCKILAADIDPNKLQAAQGAGADEVYNTGDELSLMKLIEDTQGGVKAAVDFVGAEKTLQYSFDGTKKGGQIVVVGLFGGSFEKPIPMFPLMAKSICGSFVGNLEETKEMLELVKSGKVDPIPVEKRNLSEATKTLEDLREGNITGRVVLEP